MLAFDRLGEGPPLLLLHGTTSSREIWAPLLGKLAQRADVLAVDLPGHGDSPPSSYSPPRWAQEVLAFLDGQGLGRVTVLGHSSGGWTALELAKLGRTSGVVALAPAGLWRRQSPRVTDLILNVNWRLGRLAGVGATRALRFSPARSLFLRSISAKPGDVSADVAIKSARTAITTDSFPRHFAETRRLRFLGGQRIGVSVRIVWGAGDRIALAGKSRSIDQLPFDAKIETWPGCGHMVMWDAPDRVLRVVDLALDEVDGSGR